MAKNIDSIFKEDELKQIDRAATELVRPSFMLTVSNGTILNALWHNATEEQYFDLLPTSPKENLSEFSSAFTKLGVKLSSVSTEAAFARLVAEQVRDVSKFDRVKIYKFGKDWNGEAVSSQYECARINVNFLV